MPGMNGMKTILVVDDEVKIVEVVKTYLENNGYKVVEAYRGADAIGLFDRFGPDAVVLDLMLPDMTGEEICGAIRKKSRVPIIMLTAKAEEEDILKGLKIGADDYVTKPFSPRELVARIETVLRRTDREIMPLSSEISYNNGELVIDSMRHEVRKYGKIIGFTPIEYKILLNMVRHPTRVFTREELITLAVNDDYDGFDRTIDTHIKNIRQKIEDNTRDPKYLITVHGVGYKFGGKSGRGGGGGL